MKIAGNWRKVGSGVREREDGLRVHPVADMIKTTDGTIYTVRGDFGFNRCIRIQGGNRSRALMLYANLMYPK